MKRVERNLRRLDCEARRNHASRLVEVAAVAAAAAAAHVEPQPHRTAIASTQLDREQLRSSCSEGSDRD